MSVLFVRRYAQDGSIALEPSPRFFGWSLVVGVLTVLAVMVVRIFAWRPPTAALLFGKQYDQTTPIPQFDANTVEHVFGLLGRFHFDRRNPGE
jgi:hypothetical protein